MGERNDDRSERLKTALRENLRKRKVQARGRAEPSADASSGDDPRPAPEPRRGEP